MNGSHNSSDAEMAYRIAWRCMNTANGPERHQRRESWQEKITSSTSNNNITTTTTSRERKIRKYNKQQCGSRVRSPIRTHGDDEDDDISQQTYTFLLKIYFRMRLNRFYYYCSDVSLSLWDSYAILVCCRVQLLPLENFHTTINYSFSYH